ncbi:ABC transporter ATP-binding protein [Burkholderia lata]|uniref:Glycosyl transferase family 2 n=1 Tax=Burkholderia lata (strain ATCC 17760 / DSM 23089 / LMG 22485 / NCIMB 9086 / R18194 / 383) TaxID=482957 RepID=A0A6P2QLC7_BURL3|nr:ABC transporter ATP-binding protein [Burkholderia lata]VWC20528.1 glycosyl transferase family 2 [Burkholderia lata]
MMKSLKRLQCLPAETRRALWRGVGWAVAAALLDGACGLLLVPLIRAWFAGVHAAVLQWTIALGALTLCHACVLYVAQRGGYRAGGALAAGLVERLVRHLPRIASWQAVRDSHPAGLLRGPVMQAMGIPAHLLGPLIGAIVTPLAVVAGLAWIDWRIALCLAAAAVLLFALLERGGSRTLAFEQSRAAGDREMAVQLQTFAAHQGLLRFAGQEGDARAALQHAFDEQHRRTRALMRRSLPIELGFAGAVQGVFVAMLVGGAWAVSAGRLDAATAVAVLVLLVRFIEPLAQLTQLDQALRGGWRALDTVLAVLHTPRFDSPERGTPVHDASVDAVRVGYRSTGGATLLDGVDLHCPAGGFVAIVGPTGAGKSTLLGLLARLDDPGAGRVLLGRADVRHLSEATLAATRNLVFQDNGLFRGSLAWNVRMGRPDASDAELRDALDAVGLLRDAERLPDGLESDVGPGGQLLSGGQRQRACLARALLARAPVLMFDEPTASLDELSARRVRDSLVALRGQRTRIVVTHQPALAAAADTIVVLDAGRVRATGTHAQLVEADGWYATFARAGLPPDAPPATEADLDADARPAESEH